ncbi:MAG: NUDIX hydrolase [Acidobacteriota bacterium]
MSQARASLREALSRRTGRRVRRRERAGVLIPILDDAGCLRLILTRRSNSLPTHGGQVAFPGGFVRPGEDDPATTALREAEEEIGLSPDSVEVLGLLDDQCASAGTVAVTPVVGWIARMPPLVPQSGEVARIFTIPVPDLQRPDRWTSRREPGAGRGRPVLCFEHRGETLWGLSARIVLSLLDLLPGGAPFSPRAAGDR